jgi:beta-N-acetylhexosaminidase
MTRSAGSSVDGPLRSLAAGVLLPGFVGQAPPPWLLDAVADGLAGVVYFRQNVAPGRSQPAALSAALRAARDDVLIAVDEEGGDVTRLPAGAGSDLPGNAALGVVDDESVTAAAAGAIGRDLRLAGVDLDLAPCLDVNCDPANPVIGVRSFGSSPSLVGRHGATFVRGLQAAGVAACAKHFPGHGDTTVDSHLALPVVHADAATLRSRELPPFAAAIAAGVRCVLTAHVCYPALDGVAARPATLSPSWMALLRTDLGFGGVVLTDALDMRAIAHTVGLARGAVSALAAGADLLCLGNPTNDPVRGDGEAELRLVWDAVVSAMRAGDLPVARLEEAVSRVRSLAEWTTAGRSLPLPAALPPGFGREVARLALSATGWVRLASRPELVDLRRQVNRAAGSNSGALVDELSRRSPPGGARAGMVILVDEPQRDAGVQAELRSLLARRPDAVVIATGWPDPGVDLGRNVVRTFGNGRANAVAAVDALFGQAPVTAGTGGDRRGRAGS